MIILPSDNLINQYRSEMARCVRRYGLQFADRDDVLQEAFLILLRTRKQKPDDDCRKLLPSIVRYAVQTWWTKTHGRDRRPRVIGKTNADVALSRVSAKPHRCDPYNPVVAAVRMLTLLQRRTIQLVALGSRPSEVAELLGITPRQVRSILWQVRFAMREMFGIGSRVRGCKLNRRTKC